MRPTAVSVGYLPQDGLTHAGRNVFAETCPQYLYLTLEDQLGAPGFEGAMFSTSALVGAATTLGGIWAASSAPLLRA